MTAVPVLIGTRRAPAGADAPDAAASGPHGEKLFKAVNMLVSSFPDAA